LPLQGEVGFSAGTCPFATLRPHSGTVTGEIMWTYADIDAALNRELFSNSLRQWLVAVAVAALAFLIGVLIRGVLIRRLAASAERLGLHWLGIASHVATRTRTLFLLMLALYFGSLVLVLPPKTALIINTMAVLVLLLQAALWGHAFLTAAVNDYMQRRIQKDAASVTTVSAVGFLAKVLLWTLVVLLSLDNVGVNVTALIAGLGIGGIAVALAAQNILSDLFGSLTIVLDKPFVLGDAISVGEFTGTVEHIGIRTSRLRSLSGEQLVFANSELLKSTVRNYKRLVDRRVLFTVDVIYETPTEKLMAVPGIIRDAIQTQTSVRFDRAHLKSLGPSSLVFEGVYFVQSADFNLFMDTHQKVLLTILDRFRQEKIDFAYPTQTLYLAQPEQGDPPKEVVRT
jgi:small-conductance mechanosensitive channel